MERTHQEYLKNLPEYKRLVDGSPSKFLQYHLENAIQDEHFELAKYIQETIIIRAACAGH